MQFHPNLCISKRIFIFSITYNNLKTCADLPPGGDWAGVAGGGGVGGGGAAENTCVLSVLSFTSTLLLSEYNTPALWTKQSKVV